MQRTIKDIEEILKKAKSTLQKIYGKRLKGIILYGSYARGEAVEGSDIDLIVLLDNMQNPIDELEKCSNEIHQLDFAYDTLISVIPFDLKQFNSRKLPIILNAKKEGIPI
ncbi:MAG: nucleotidyltransferase domain-containing protein [Candidatus Methanoperedens sp.]|nr:nucleotidyltransferase domain-containing protein [Candidatus Methanoperedens sp.]